MTPTPTTLTLVTVINHAKLKAYSLPSSSIAYGHCNYPSDLEARDPAFQKFTFNAEYAGQSKTGIPLSKLDGTFQLNDIACLNKEQTKEKVNSGEWICSSNMDLIGHNCLFTTDEIEVFYGTSLEEDDIRESSNPIGAFSLHLRKKDVLKKYFSREKQSDISCNHKSNSMKILTDLLNKYDDRIQHLKFNVVMKDSGAKINSISGKFTNFDKDIANVFNRFFYLDNSKIILLDPNTSSSVSSSISSDFSVPEHRTTQECKDKYGFSFFSTESNSYSYNSVTFHDPKTKQIHSTSIHVSDPSKLPTFNGATIPKLLSPCTLQTSESSYSFYSKPSLIPFSNIESIDLPKITLSLKKELLSIKEEKHLFNIKFKSLDVPIKYAYVKGTYDLYFVHDKKDIRKKFSRGSRQRKETTLPKDIEFVKVAVLNQEKKSLDIQTGYYIKKTDLDNAETLLKENEKRRKELLKKYKNLPKNWKSCSNDDIEKHFQILEDLKSGKIIEPNQLRVPFAYSEASTEIQDYLKELPDFSYTDPVTSSVYIVPTINPDDYIDDSRFANLFMEVLPRSAILYGGHTLLLIKLLNMDKVESALMAELKESYSSASFHDIASLFN